MTLFLLLIGALLPIIAFSIDRKQKPLLESSQHEINMSLVKKIAVKRLMYLEVLQYRKDKFLKYRRMLSLRPMAIFSKIFLDVHPLFSIYFHFDISLSRLNRAFILLF